MDQPRNTVDVRRFLGLLCQPGDVFEVRAPECRDRRDTPYAYTCSGYFTFEMVDAAVTTIVELDRSAIAPGIYVTMNPIAPSLLARAANRIKARARETTQDKDVMRRRWLLIDVDPIRPAGVSATCAELALSLERARAIVEYLASLEWPSPCLALSGNGYHLLYRIDLPIDDGGLVKAILAALADRFSDAAVAVDRAVHNPSRIIKVIGTVARKGDDLRNVDGVEDRPHRQSGFVEVPEEITVVTESRLRAVATDDDGSNDTTRANSVTPVSKAAGDSTHRFDCTPSGVRAWLEGRGVSVKAKRRAGDKTLLLLERCPINPEIVSTGGSDIAVMVGDDGKLAYCNKHNRGQDYTWHDLRRAVEPGYEPRAAENGTVDLSAFDISTRESAQRIDSNKHPVDPGLLPEHLLRIPGFVGEVMDFCLATAPYPNTMMAFGGALALQAFVAGRKVRDPGDNRTNIYLLGLAHSSAGKDWPRKLNTRIVHAMGLSTCLGDRLASGEGLQDALFAAPAMLVQTDEIDGMLQSINKSRDARHESMMGTLLTLYSSSNTVFPMRRKAGNEHPGIIDQPCLVLFGTAIPNHYYEALSERMLTNGFFARMLILESSQRGKGQEPSIRDLPPRIVTTAKWWADFRSGGNLSGCHPAPAIVEHTRQAKRLLADTRAEADAEYARAESAQDAVGTTVWGRVSEQARKLALLHALSENHTAPRIGVAAARWASEVVIHQVRRMLFMAAGHVAENPFHADCLRLLKKLRESPTRALPHHVLLKRMKVDAKGFRDLIETLEQRGDIVIDTVATEGRTRKEYRLTMNEGEQS